MSFFFVNIKKVYLMEISDNLTLLIENMLCSTMHNSEFKWI